MNSVNYFKKANTDELNCAGLECSFSVPKIYLSREEQLCIGIGLSIEEWLDVWRTKDCSSIFHRMIYRYGSYSSEGFMKAVECYNYMFYSYYGPYDCNNNPKGGHVISDEDEMSSYLINSCIKNQGVCQCVSYNMCSGCTSLEIHESKLLRKLGGCACISATSNSYQIESACDPSCASSNVSKRRNIESGEIETCKRKVCFIDPVTGVPFDEMCPHCSDNKCVCIVNGKGHFEQYKNNCSDIINDNDEDEESSEFPYGWLLILFILILAVIAVIILQNPTTDTELGQEEVSPFSELPPVENFTVYSNNYIPEYSFNLMPAFITQTTTTKKKK